jgi:arylsulfatase A
MKTLRPLSLFLCILILIFASSKAPSDTQRPPNIIFILADDLGYGDFSCYGATHFKTPACDRVAKEGMLFRDAHSPSSVCTPTRYSVLTGRYAWRSWLKNWVVQQDHPLLIDTERLTMGKFLQNAGYTTGCVGKWHLGWGSKQGESFNKELKPGVLEVGFDSFFGVPFSHNSGPALQVFMRDRHIVNLKEGMDYKSAEAKQLTMRKLEDTAIDLSKEAVTFINKNKDKPFFLYYPTTNIHFPITPNSRFKGKTKAGAYGEFVIEFDWAVGQVLKALDQNNLTNNTLLVLTSDNGARPHPSLNGHLYNGSLRGTKRQIYEGGHRVPLIVRWPGKVKKGSITDETVCLTDFFTTFANITKQTLPKNAGEDSYDLTDLLLGKTFDKPLREATIHHSVGGQFAIRQGDWKLIETGGNGDFPKNEKGKKDVKTKRVTFDAKTNKPIEMDYFKRPHDGKFQLYNLKNDPGETKNLDKEKPEIVKELLKLLNQYRNAKRSAPFQKMQ